MTKKQNTNKDIGSRKEEVKIWIGDDGIVRVKTDRLFTEEGVYEMIKKAGEAARRVPGKAKILIDIGTTLPFGRSSPFRKIVGQRVGQLAKDLEFEKIAVCTANIATKTVTSFLVVASGVKNIKVFSNEKKALEWLKRP